MSNQTDRAPLFVAIAGIVVVAIGAFLPIWDTGSVTFSSLQGNSLVQAGDGWITLGSVAVSAFFIGRAFQGRALNPGGLIGPGVITMLVAIYNGTSDDVMTLCPAGATSLDTEGCQRAQAGLGIFATGLGGALLIAAGALIWKARRDNAASPVPDGEPPAAS